MRASLIVEGGIAQPVQCCLDDASVVLLGRSRDNTIVLADRRASRSHARIYAHEGRFWIGHRETTNGTSLDGRPLQSDTPLVHGQLIGIGDVRIRFVLSPSESGIAQPRTADDAAGAPNLEADLEPDADTTEFEADDLTALFRFMKGSLGEATPARLVSLALEAALRQTGADLAGYLSLDVENPDLHLVLPPQASVDRHLSHQLTQRVLNERRTIWLGATDAARMDSESLSDVHDAICVALRVGHEPAEAPLGALHVYKHDRLFSERQVRFCEVLGGSLAQALHLLRGRRALEADNRRLRGHASAGEQLIGSSHLMAQLRQNVRRLAVAPCTVLINGESGTGKELVALELHRSSARRNGPLVTVNCAAINETMAESELFGHVKGAFTGAVRDHAGYFAQADMGTLFLDEIGELSLDLQKKLLRAIEYRSFRPVGATGESKADVRIIAATNRDLEREVREGNFRRDLFFRLTSKLDVRPLRDHLEDVPELVEHFLEVFAVEYRRKVTLAEAAMERLVTFSWPGNVRQLRSVLETAVAMADPGGMIHAGDLRLVADPLGSTPGDCPATLDLIELEEWAIRRAMERADGVMTHAARLLGIHRETLGLKLKKYGIERQG